MDSNRTYSGLSQEEFDGIYEVIKRKLLEGLTPVEEPLAVVLGGQPGSGKSNIYDFYEEECEGNIAAIDCDAFRKYFPDAEKIAREDPDNFGSRTNEFVFAASDRLVEELSREGYSFILESTSKNTGVLEWIAKTLPEQYRIDLAAMATPAEVSRKGITDRYEAAKAKGEVPRKVPMELHDEVVEKVGTTVGEVYDRMKDGTLPVDRIRIFNRDKEELYNSRKEETSKNPRNPGKLLDDIIQGREPVTQEKSSGTQEKPSFFSRMVEKVKGMFAPKSPKPGKDKNPKKGETIADGIMEGETMMEVDTFGVESIYAVSNEKSSLIVGEATPPQATHEPEQGKQSERDEQSVPEAEQPAEAIEMD